MKLGELRNWLWSEGAPMKRNWLAAVLYVVAALALLVTPLLGRNLTFLDFSGSGFWNAEYVNDFCTKMFGQAKLFGSMNPEHGFEAYYPWRLTGILAGWGYVAWGAILAMEETEENT
jgi:hypothetical protein